MKQETYYKAKMTRMMEDAGKPKREQGGNPELDNKRKLQPHLSRENRSTCRIPRAQGLGLLEKLESQKASERKGS